MRKYFLLISFMIAVSCTISILYFVHNFKFLELSLVTIPVIIITYIKGYYDGKS